MLYLVRTLCVFCALKYCVTPIKEAPNMVNPTQTTAPVNTTNTVTTTSTTSSMSPFRGAMVRQASTSQPSSAPLPVPKTPPLLRQARVLRNLQHQQNVTTNSADITSVTSKATPPAVPPRGSSVQRMAELRQGYNATNNLANIPSVTSKATPPPVPARSSSVRRMEELKQAQGSQEPAHRRSAPNYEPPKGDRK